MLVPTMLPPGDVPEFMRAFAITEADLADKDASTPSGACVDGSSPGLIARLVNAVNRAARFGRGLRIGPPQTAAAHPAD